MIPAHSATTANDRNQIDIYFVVGDEKIPFEQFGDSREDEIMKRTARMVSEEVGLVRCPVHNESASSVTFVRSDNGTYASYEVHGCCQKLVKRVERQLR